MSTSTTKNVAAERWTLAFALSIALLALPLAQPAEASHAPTYLQIEPETHTSANGTVHTFTATFRDEALAPIELAEGQLVDFEIISGPNANLTPGFRDFECPSNSPTQGATCTASYTDAAAFDSNNSVDMVCAWISTDGDDDQYDPNGVAADGGDCDLEQPRETDMNDLTDTILKTWVAPMPTFLDIDPETDTNPANTVQTFTAVFTDQDGHPIELSEGQLVDFEIMSGPNTNLSPAFRDFECPSNSPTVGGTCTATYMDGTSFDPNNRTDVVCAWISTDGDDDQYNPAGTVADGGDCDVELPDETEEGLDEFGHTIEGQKGNDLTDKITVTWTVQTFTHARTIGINFAHSQGDLVVSGMLAATVAYAPCVASQPVRVQRFLNGKWDTKATVLTNAQGRYRAELADRTGKYRALAPQTAHADADPSKRHVCSAAQAAKSHSH